MQKKMPDETGIWGSFSWGNESYLFVDKNGYFFTERLCFLPVYPLPKVCGRMYCTVVQNGLVNAALFLPFKLFIPGY